MAYPRTRDDVATECRIFKEASKGRPMFENAFAAALENLDPLRNEFDFETVKPHRTLGELVLKPFSDKPAIHIYADKPGACRVYLYDGESVLEESVVAQEQLIAAVYDYMARLRKL